jgi:cytochrome c
MRTRLAYAFTSLALAALLALPACSSGAATTPATTSTPGTQGTTATTSQTTTTATQTVGELATAGREVFKSQCQSCHGSDGGGLSAPAVIGTSASLGKFSNGLTLYNFISASMPFTAPGRLSQQQYLEVTAFILLQNQLIAETATLDEAAMAGIALS